MGCHTWKYLPIDKLPKRDFEFLKKQCDKIADNILNNSVDFEKLYDIYKRYDKDITIEIVKEKHQQSLKKAKKYKEEIKTSPQALLYYIHSSFKENNIIYINCGTLDKYIRLSDYPEIKFYSAKQLIEYCNEINWEGVYIYRLDEWTRTLATDHRDEAILIITEMFDKNPDMIVQCG